MYSRHTGYDTTSPMSKNKTQMKLEMTQTISFSKHPDWIWSSLPGVKLPGHKITHLHLAPSFRMNGDIPLIPLYACMAWTGNTILLYYLTLYSCCQLAKTLLKYSAYLPSFGAKLRVFHNFGASLHHENA